MRNNTTGFFLLFIFVFFNAYQANSQSYIRSKSDDKQNKSILNLIGEIPGLLEGETVYMREFYYPREVAYKLIDSVPVKNGEFNFQYHIEEGPRFFLFSFSKHKQLIAIPLLNENVTIRSNHNINQFPPGANILDYLEVNGSALIIPNIYLNFGILRMWRFAISKINKDFTKLNDSDYKKEDLQYVLGLLKGKELINQTVAETLKMPPVNKLIPQFFLDLPVQLQREHFFFELYNLLDEETKNGYYGKRMKELLPLLIGQPAPDFTFITLNGKNISLNSIVKKAKVTILHFWSSASNDRRKIHKELLTAYNKYHSNGLEIVSISLDANSTKWKKAVDEDMIPGYQSCDLKEEESDPAKLYKIVPREIENILIDENGKIFAWDLYGPKLFGYLHKIFEQ